MNLLLTGATGLLGSYIVQSWDGEEGELTGIYIGDYKPQPKKNVTYYEADVRDPGILAGILKRRPVDFIVHAAGEARVDFCERNYTKAYSSNVIGTRNMIELCKRFNADLAYISTNAVFDGTKAPYSETDTVNPVNAYGKIKLECENSVREQCDDALIVRPILMYGWNRPEERANVATWIMNKLRNKKEIMLVDDIFDNPLYARECAEALLKRVAQRKRGTYHIAGKDVTNRYQFGVALADVFGYDKNLIHPVKNSYFKGIAPRPENTSYNTTKIEKELGMKFTGIREGLLEMKKEREHAGQRAFI